MIAELRIDDDRVHLPLELKRYDPIELPLLAQLFLIVHGLRLNGLTFALVLGSLLDELFTLLEFALERLISF